MIKITIIGGGISGLATAFALEKEAAAQGLAIDLLLLEKESRLGGKIWSRQEEGFLCEWGPNGFLDNKPMTLELCRQLGISSQLLRSSDNARKRFIYAAGILNRLPENGPSFLQSKLISWPGKFRLAAELAIPARRDGEDETLADFARRRLGAEALDRLIGPMVSGIFAGDPETMSLKSCFPRIHELEQEYGGLLKAMIKLGRQKRAARKAGEQVASAAGPGGILTSFTDGLQSLPAAAAGQIRGEIRSASEVTEIVRTADGYQLGLTDGSSINSDLVVSACPAYALAGMLEQSLPEMSTLLRETLYAPMNVVCLGYQRSKISHDLNGFGYLIPKSEGRQILGTLWDSSIFPNRAPEGMVLLRSMMGGAANAAAADLSDQEVEQRTSRDLERIMGITAQPDFVRIFRHQRAIPQYTVGHSNRLDRLLELSRKLPGLFLVGNAYFGIGLNDCVNAANQTAGRIIEHLKLLSRG